MTADREPLAVAGPSIDQHPGGAWRSFWKRGLGAVAAVALVATVVQIAGPAAVVRLLLTTRPGMAAVAAMVVGCTFLLRGCRLLFLLPAGRLTPLRAVVVAAAAQAAALFLPLRLGELVLPWLLRRLTGLETAAGIATMLAARTIDLATLGAWAAGGVLLLWGTGSRLALVAAVLLLLPPLLLPTVLATADRLAVRMLAPRGQRWRRWARRLRRLDRAVAEVRQRPGRLVLAVLSSLTMWAAIWCYTWLLLKAMNLHWPPLEVAAGAAVASLANLLPINLVANIGTLEAGWTAVFSALGYPVEQAAASGLAAHLWTLLLAACYGAIAWMLVLAHPLPAAGPAAGTGRPEPAKAD